jgi:Mg2+ and Co2+ transporter CorA
MSSLDQFSTMADNLIDFTFNMNSHATNNQMKRMTILMIVFLPLTLLTGYFVSRLRSPLDVPCNDSCVGNRV